MTPPRRRWPTEPGPCSVEATERAVPRQALAVAAFAAALANQPADQVADLARRAIAAGSRPLPEPGDPPWFPERGDLALNCRAERYDEAQVLARRRRDRGTGRRQRDDPSGGVGPAGLARPPAWRSHRRRGRCTGPAGRPRSVASAAVRPDGRERTGRGAGRAGRPRRGRADARAPGGRPSGHVPYGQRTAPRPRPPSVRSASLR